MLKDKLMLSLFYEQQFIFHENCEYIKFKSVCDHFFHMRMRYLIRVDISISHICWHTIPRSWVGRNHEGLWCITWSECYVNMDGVPWWRQLGHRKTRKVGTYAKKNDKEISQDMLWSCYLWTRMINRNTCSIRKDTALARCVARNTQRNKLQTCLQTLN